MHAMEGPQPQMPSLPPCLPASTASTHPFLLSLPPCTPVCYPKEWPQVAKLPLCQPRTANADRPTDSPPTTQGGVQTPRPVFPSLRCLGGFDMLNLTGECIHRQTSQDNGISNTQVRIELAAWLMIDEQEIKLSSPRLCGCRLLPRIYSPTLQQSTHALASLI